MAAACAAEGRDLATLTVTAGVRVRNPAMTHAGAGTGLSGSPEEVVAGPRDFAAAGVARVICSITSPTKESLAHLSDVLAVYHRLGS